MLANFQPAKLYAPSNGTWRIQWYNLHPYTNSLERVQKTFGLNRIKSKKERQYVAAEHVRLLNTSLKLGYNYFIDTEGLKGNGDTVNLITIHDVLKAILPIRLQGKKKRTIESYKSFNSVFTEWLIENEYNTLPANGFTFKLWQEFINYKISKGHKNRNINDFTTYFKSTFDKAIRQGLMCHNPLFEADRLPNVESTLFQALTPKELLEASRAIQEQHIRYYIYTKFTALEYVRPYHISFIKARDLDFENDLIAINATSSKNKKVKYKQMIPDLKKTLLKYKYHELPGNYYLFGKNFEPSPTHYESLSKRSAEIWREIVIQGLGIDKKMYGLKYTGSQFYVNENDSINAGWLQHQMEHHSLSETETYIHKRKFKRIDLSNVKLIEY